MKTSRVSSALDRQVARKEKNTKQRRIDFSDIPELSERQLASMRRVGRPLLGEQPRKLIAIRLDPKVLKWVKGAATRRGQPYQSFINDILAREMQEAEEFAG